MIDIAGSQISIIYRFYGALLKEILGFCKEVPTPTVLHCAYCFFKNNKKRIMKIIILQGIMKV